MWYPAWRSDLGDHEGGAVGGGQWVAGGGWVVEKGQEDEDVMEVTGSGAEFDASAAGLDPNLPSVLQRGRGQGGGLAHGGLAQRIRPGRRSGQSEDDAEP